MNELLTNLPLLVFLIITVNYMVGAFFIVYHLTKFGLDSKTRILTIIFLSGSAVFVFLSFYFFFQIDWQELYQHINLLKL